MAEDLWVDAVNACPAFAHEFVQAIAGYQQGKQLPISAIGKYGKKDFDLSNLMGELLYREEKADLSTLFKVIIYLTK